MSRRTAIIVFFILVAAGIAAYTLTCTVLSAWVFGLGNGSPSYAEQWRDRLAVLSDPDAAQSAYPEVEVRRFANGEWVFGVSADSHGSHWGGTVVVKDSSGRVRISFGHVCGPEYFKRLSNADSLAKFYSHPEWEHWGFREYSFE